MSNIPAISGGNPVRNSFLVFGSPDIRDSEINEVVDTLRSGWLSTGPKTKKFEQNFANYKGVKHAVGLYSCTAALHMGLAALDLQPGDEVITTDYTFTASVSSIIHNQLKPVLVDVGTKTQNINWPEIESKITPRTRAILPVHMCGYPCDMDEIVDIANRYSLHIVEDCAHAVETKYKGNHAGTFGSSGAFSFYVTKNIACGEGGMLITNDELVEEDVRKRSLHGMSKNAHNRYGASGFQHYQVLYAGYKYNMTDITASLGLHQLDRVEENWAKRKVIWEKYMEGLKDLPIYLPYELSNKDDRHGYHLFTIQLKLDQLKINRDFALGALKAEGIGTGVHYKAIHTHPYYSKVFGWTADQFPNAQWLSDRTISLPLSSKLTDEDTNHVIEACHKVFKYYWR